MMKMDLPKAFELTKEDRNSQLWGRLMEHWGSRIDTLRKSNDKDLGDVETALLRGAIREVQRNLALDKALPIID